MARLQLLHGRLQRNRLKLCLVPVAVTSTAGLLLGGKHFPVLTPMHVMFIVQVLLAYGAQSVAVEEYRPDGAREQVRPSVFLCRICCVTPVEPCGGACTGSGPASYLRLADRAFPPRPHISPRRKSLLTSTPRGGCGTAAPWWPTSLQRWGHCATVTAWRGHLALFVAAMAPTLPASHGSLPATMLPAQPLMGRPSPSSPCIVQEVAAAGLLEATAADFGLSHQHVTVEAVRTQDWEQSIKVGWLVCTLRCWGRTADLATLLLLLLLRPAVRDAVAWRAATLRRQVRLCSVLRCCGGPYMYRHACADLGAVTPGVRAACAGIPTLPASHAAGLGAGPAGALWALMGTSAAG